MATVESEAGAKLDEIGMQLMLLGAVALFLGALRLFLSNRTRARVFLATGLLCFALGLVPETFEELGALELNYYPGWRTDLDETFLKIDPDLEFSDDDLEVGFGEPAWWEGTLWWGQRVARVLGLGLAATGFLLDGRWLLRQKGRKAKRAGRARAR